jgi:hypothetical protein
MSNPKPDLEEALKKFSDIQITNGDAVKNTGKRNEVLGKIIIPINVLHIFMYDVF